MNDNKEPQGLYVIEDMGSHNSPSVKGENILIEMREEVREERMEDVENILNINNSNMEEPNYHFLTKEGGALLFPSQGKTIKCYS